MKAYTWKRKPPVVVVFELSINRFKYGTYFILALYNRVLALRIGHGHKST